LHRPAHPSSDHHNDECRRLSALTPDGIKHGREASASARALNDLFFSAVAPEQLTNLGDILDTLTTASEARS
jgi:hypothetical protein